MSSRRSLNKQTEDHLSSFDQRLQSLNDTFYSTILEDSKDKKHQIKNAKEFEHLQTSQYNNLTFDKCSTSNDDFSFFIQLITQKYKKNLEKIK